MKKKLLTLIFTLALLIGLVAAMGMNASAADSTVKSYVDVNSWEDLYDFLQQSPAGFTAILTDNIVESNDLYDFEFPQITVDGSMTIDLNGYDIDITSDATKRLFNINGNSTTKLHIVNTREDVDSNIILNTTQDDASIFYIGQKDSDLNIYAGVNLAMGTNGYYFRTATNKSTAAIDAMSFKNINLYGANIQNRMAYGVGINFPNLGNNAYEANESRVYISTGSVIKSKYMGLYCFNSTSAPIINLYDCTFDWESSLPTGASNYCTKANYDAFYFYKTGIGCTDLLAYSTYKMKQDGNSIDTTKPHNYYVGAKITVTPSDCPHASNTTTINYLAENGGQPGEAHFMVCGLCRKYVENDMCTYVGVKAATCTATGYTKGGVDCDCGYRTAVVEAKKDHDYKLVSKRASTCTSIGYSTDIYLCESCSGKFDSNKVELTPVQLGKIVIPKKSHDYQDVVTKKATLTSDGVIASKCTGCEDVQSAVSVIRIESVTLSATKYIYDGKNKTPKVTVKDANGKTLVKNTDYKITVASKRSGIGRYTVKVTFIGNYSGTKNLYFYILPGKPASVKSASQGTTSNKLTWSEVPGAAGYTLYYYSNSKKAYVKINTTTDTTYTVKGLLTGTKYTFKIVAYGKTSSGKVYDSETYALLKSATKTKTPALTKVTASSTKGKAYVYHTDVKGETGYTVYYSTSKTTGFKKYNNFKADTTRCDITKLTSGKTYYFKVRTYITTDSGYVYSAWSDIMGVKVK